MFANVLFEDHSVAQYILLLTIKLGFTTDFDDACSSDYCTSLAAAIQAPVFHVNGDYPEMVVKCA